MYFTNQMQAKITSSNTIENIYQTIPIKENFLIFDMIINGEPLKKYEKKVGKTFLKYEIYYITSSQDGSQNWDIFSPIECTEQNFSNYQCMSEADFMNKDLFTRPMNNEIGYYGISILSCDPQTQINCATDQEIQDMIFNDANYLTFFIKTQQYNPQTLQYETGYKQEFFYFDPSFYFVSKINLSKATTRVTKGLIIQSSENKETIYDYKRIDSIKSLEFKNRLEYEDIMWIIFQIDQVCTQISVQHPMITEVLSQFMSIFNSLLIIGMFARKLAQTKIVDDMNNLLLKEYYKKTTAKLIIKNERIKTQNQFQIGVTSKEILNLQKHIDKIDYQQIKQQIFKGSLLSRIKNLVFKLFKVKKLETKIQIEEIENHKSICKKLLNESVRKINLFELYKDVLHLKMALRLILTKEQFAALKFCGSDILTNNHFHDDNDNSSQLIPNSRKSTSNIHLNKFQSMNSKITTDQASQKQKSILQRTLIQYQPEQESNIITFQELKIFDQNSDRQLQEKKYEEYNCESSREKQAHFNSGFSKSILVIPQSNQGDFGAEIQNSQVLEDENMKRNLKNNESIKNKKTQTAIFYRDHLQEMDLIDESEEAQGYFLEKFLQNSLSKRGLEENSTLDLKILSSLLLNDFKQDKEADIGIKQEKNMKNQEEVEEINLQIDKNILIVTDKK